MLIGLVLIGAGGYHMLKGWTTMFLRDLTKHPGRFAVRAGVVGHLAKGVSLALVGVLFVIAAQDNTSARSTGLDGALRLLRQQAFGPWLLTVVALGIAVYGLYSFARARLARGPRFGGAVI
jgi:type IV secretory pathway VirB2 component (pilin)